MESPVPSVLTVHAWRQRCQLNLSLPTDSSLSDSPFCFVFIHKALWKIQQAELSPPIHLFSFPGCALWNILHDFSFSSCVVNRSTSFVNSKSLCSALWTEIKISHIAINCCLEHTVQLLKNFSFIGFGKLFQHQSTGQYCFAAPYSVLLLEAKKLIDPKLWE